MEQIIIREATLNDMESLLRFEQGVIEAERPCDPTIRDGHINYYDIERMIAASHIRLVVAELDGGPIGCGYARIENGKHYLKHTHQAYLGFMYVLPGHRGKGVVKKIIGTLKQWAISQNINEMVLEVYNNNLPAIKAYERAGFSKYFMTMRMGLEES